MEVWVSPPDLCKEAADPTPLPNPAHQWLRVFNIQSCPYCTCFLGRGEDWMWLQKISWAEWEKAGAAKSGVTQ